MKTDDTSTIPTDFAAFWPFYLHQHSVLLNRRLHFIGTLLGIVCLVIAIVQSQLWWLLGLPLCGYSLAWFGHFVIEHNRPATFKRPLLSLIGDYKMFFLILTGQMEKEMLFWQERGFKKN